ncbi:hypothetical protein THRCLA_20510 [Thraustotheca clavata]|uniref:Transmembrane protein n=1 Tax=Thraustotheca clavata TaxID=74557 RepID=A0A1W0A6F5_9STRA|nr:hypothetical protein THRCLA_20510 [Thraustotheca clavata]
MSHNSWRHGYILLRRLLSCVCTLFVVHIEYRATVDNRSVLAGALLPAEPSNAYTSPLIMPFLKMLINAEKHPLVPLNGSTTYIYMDRDNQTNIQFLSSCYEQLPGDTIYSSGYLNQLLEYLLAFPLNNSYVVIDCQYTGRITQDTTALKVYTLDYTQTTFTTFFLQTMTISRPSKYRQAACGTATIASISLDLIDEQDMTIKSTKTLNEMYTTLVGVDFPYEISSPFKVAILKDKAKETGAWDAYISNEVISLQGTEGIYRTAVDSQGNYDYYVWDLPSNPIEFASIIQYINASHSKDSYAWLRLLIGVGITLNIVITLLVAMLTSFHLYIGQQVIWVPDLFPCIQHRVILRALLCGCVLWITDWWHIFEWSLAETNARLGLTGTFVLSNIAIADVIMVSLAIFTSVAHLLNVCIGLEVVLLIMYGCYECRVEITETMGLCRNSTDEYAYANFQQNTFVTDGNGMGLWAYHENNQTQYFVIITAFTWWLLGVSLTCIYVILLKVFEIYEQKSSLGWQNIQVKSAGRRRSSIRNSLIKVAVGPRITLQDSLPNTTLTTWCKRSLLYSPYIKDDLRVASQVERSTRCLIGNIFGLVADFEDEDFHGHISISPIWLLGYVVLNKRWLIAISDYPRWLLNVLFQHNIFRVYGYHITEATPAPYKERVPYIDDLKAKDRVNLTLFPLT